MQDGQARENELELERFIPLWVEVVVLDNLGPVQVSRDVVLQYEVYTTLQRVNYTLASVTQLNADQEVS